MTIAQTLPGLALRSQEGGWDRARWEQLPDDGNRYEVIDGVLYMTTTLSAFHQWIIRQIFLILNRHIDEPGVGVTLWSPIGLFMPGCDPVQPDILVIRRSDLGMIHDRHIFGVPALLVEVLSPANSDYDLRIKRRAYANAGVPEYWIVRPATRDLMLCTQPDATLGDYASTHLVGPHDDLRSPSLPVSTPVARFFADAPDTTL